MQNDSDKPLQHFCLFLYQCVISMVRMASKFGLIGLRIFFVVVPISQKTNFNNGISNLTPRIFKNALIQQCISYTMSVNYIAKYSLFKSMELRPQQIIYSAYLTRCGNQVRYSAFSTFQSLGFITKDSKCFSVIIVYLPCYFVTYSATYY